MNGSGRASSAFAATGRAAASSDAPFDRPLWRRHSHAALDHPGYRFLTVPGLHGSGPGHWQTRWEVLHPALERVRQRDWHAPCLDEWAQAIDGGIRAADRPVVLLAHSFGCLASLHRVNLDPRGVAAMLLVAPADPTRFQAAEKLLSARARAPAFFIASRNDPWLDLAAARIWSRLWNTRLVMAGRCGHINADSKLGDWRQGQDFVGRLLFDVAQRSSLAG